MIAQPTDVIRDSACWAAPVQGTDHAKISFCVRPHPHDAGSCPTCLSRMLFVRIVAGSSGFELHTFECPTCDHVHKVIVATGPLEPKPFRHILRESQSPKHVTVGDRVMPPSAEGLLRLAWSGRSQF